jgi:hypothetical protein
MNPLRTSGGRAWEKKITNHSLLNNRFGITIMNVVSRFAVASVAVLCCLPALSHPLDTWHIRHSANGSGDLLGVCYGQGVFVAVGINGTIYTSSTGKSWTLQTSGTSASLRKVAHRNGVFVAVGNGGTILSSSDGTNWTTQATENTNFLGSVVFGGGQFVAAGWHVSLTSPDGLSWAVHTHGFDTDSTTLVYGNGLFLMEGKPGTNVVSTDGTNWFEQAAGTSFGLWTVGFVRGEFFAIDTTGESLTSSNGSQWVHGGSVPVLRPAGVVYANGDFVTAGSGAAVYSGDGHNWKTAPVSLTPRDMCFGDGTIVVVGYQEVIIQSDPLVWLESEAAGVITVSGPVNRTCSIEAIDAIGSQWVPLTNFTLTTSPQIWWDLDQTNHLSRLYRAVMQSE